MKTLFKIFFLTSAFSLAISVFSATTIPVPYGGTGLSSVPAGNFLVGSSTYNLEATSSIYITPTGKIGIGTTSPYRLLDLSYTTAGEGLGLHRNLELSSGANQGAISFYSNLSGNKSLFSQILGTASYLNNTKGDISFMTSDNGGFNEKMRVSSNYGVGIGTINNYTHSPTGKLEVGTDNDSNILTLSSGKYPDNPMTVGEYNGINFSFRKNRNPSAVLASYIKSVADGNFYTSSAYNDASLHFGTINDGTINDKMIITSDGNIAVGDTTSAQRLRLVDSTKSVQLAMSSTGSGGRTYHLINTDSSASIGGGFFSLFDNTAGAYRFVMDGTGNFALGTTTAPNDLVIVNGPNATTTLSCGSAYSQTKRCVQCLWNGASYTKIYYPTNSITPVIATSTTCS